MKTVRLAMIAMIVMLFGDLVVSQETNKSDLSRLQAIYTNNIQKLTEKYTTLKTNLPSAYDKELNDLEAFLAKKSNLDGVLAVQKEKERRKLNQAILIPDSAVVKNPAELKALQDKYINLPKAIIADHTKEYILLSSTYITHLEKAKATFTKKMKISEAVEYKNEIDNVNGIMEAALPKELVRTNILVAVTNTADVTSNQVARLPVNDKLPIEKAEPAPNTPTNSIVIDLGDNITMQFAFIPKGEFMMGSAKTDSTETYGIDISSEIQHKVKLTKNYWMGIYEVTQEQWEKVMGNNPSKSVGAKQPVEQVSWYDCQEFISKLNKRGSEFKLPKSYCFRLPTEAEWEYACRAGTTTMFYTGDGEADLDKAGWCKGKIHPVGEKQANDWGLYDMHGNVSEWCNDWAGGYDKTKIVNPTGASSSNCKVIRGGSASKNLFLNCRSGARHTDWIPSVRYYGNGFRIVLAPKL